VKRALAAALAAMAVITAAPAGADIWVDTDATPLELEAAGILTRMAGIWPELDETVIDSATMPIGTLAATNGYVIILNDIYTEDGLDAAVAQNVGSGWFPDGCSGLTAVIIHEAGHVIDVARGGRARAELTARYGDGQDIPWGALPGYSYAGGVLDPAEALASAFAATVCGGWDNSTAMERELTSILLETQ
jgi:hypothetical protein